MSTKRFHKIVGELASKGKVKEIIIGNVTSGKFLYSVESKQVTISPRLFTELQLEFGGPFDAIYGIPVNIKTILGFPVIEKKSSIPKNAIAADIFLDKLDMYIVWKFVDE